MVERLSRLPFWLLSLGLLTGYTLFAFWFPLRPYVTHVPQLDIRSFTPSLIAALAYLLLLCFLFGLYWLAFRAVQQRLAAPTLGMLLLLTFLFCLPLLFTYPINATDIYRYFIQGRISVVHNANPLAVPPEAFPADPYVLMAGEWINETSPYGPVWELTAALLTRFTANNLFEGLLAFKLLAMALHLACTSLIWHLQPALAPAERAGRALLWGWNPGLLLIFIVDGHNDILMMFWLLAGWWLLQRQRPLLGIWVMALAPLTKLIGLLSLPYFFLWAWPRSGSRSDRLRFALAGGLGLIILTALAFLPFGSPFDLVQRLIREASLGGSFSPLVFFILIAQSLGFYPGLTGPTNLTSLLFALLAVWLLWRVRHGRSPLRTAADIFAGYLLQAINYRIWYASWPFPWLLLDGERKPQEDPRLMAGLWFLFTSQVSVLIYGHLRVYGLGGEHELAHFIGVPFTFGLPLAVGYWVWRREGQPAAAGVESEK